MPTFFYNNHHPFNRGKSAITNLQAHINNNTPPTITSMSAPDMLNGIYFPYLCTNKTQKPSTLPHSDQYIKTPLL